VFRIVNEQTRAAVENPVARVLKEGTTVGLANHTLLLAKDGTERPIDDSGAPISDGHGGVGGVVLVFRDVTERRRSERELREADRRKDEFLAMLSHELRNPLAPIRNSLHVMKVAEGPQDAEAARQIAERQVAHLVHLVDDLLDVSRITWGRIQLKRRPIALADAVASAVESAQPRIDSAGQRLSLSLPREPLWVDGDPTRLAQVFANLLNNAAKFSRQPGTITLAVERKGDLGVVSVRDEGVGISAELQPRLFDVFVQGDRSPERSEGGLGIGLTLVKKLVELHGGSVSVKSEGPGKGSEFEVRLPLLAQAPQQPEAEARTVASSRPRRVLVVDDNVDAAESVAMVLKIAGHEVRMAHSGPEAVTSVERFEPEIVVLDIGLPGMNGYEVAQQLRSGDDAHKPVLVALTGYGQDEDRARAHDAGFDHHLTKPVEPTALMDLFGRL
jgi:signal transduction histidine kinase